MTIPTDPGAVPHVFDVEAATLENELYRQTLWTGTQLQLTVMAIPSGQDVGLEVHDDHDQFLRVEGGTGTAYLGESKDAMTTYEVADGSAVFIPAGYWHNLVNSGDQLLKLYSIYAPPEHPQGAIHVTQAEAMEAEGH